MQGWKWKIFFLLFIKVCNIITGFRTHLRLEIKQYNIFSICSSKNSEMTTKHTWNKQNKNRVSKVVEHYFSSSMVMFSWLVFTKYFLILIQDQQPKFLFLRYSKAMRYTFSRSADLGDTRFWIGYKNIFRFTHIFAIHPSKSCISRKFWTLLYVEHVRKLCNYFQSLIHKKIFFTWTQSLIFK